MSAPWRQGGCPVCSPQYPWSLAQFLAEGELRNYWLHLKFICPAQVEYGHPPARSPGNPFLRLCPEGPPLRTVIWARLAPLNPCVNREALARDGIFTWAFQTLLHLLGESTKSPQENRTSPTFEELCTLRVCPRFCLKSVPPPSRRQILQIKTKQFYLKKKNRAIEQHITITYQHRLQHTGSRSTHFGLCGP